MNTSYRTHPAYEAVHQPIAQHNSWQPSVWKRLPWATILGLTTALLGIAASAVILAESNGKPITDWYFQPTVYLAIVTAVTNILLSLSLAEAVNIAWWRRAQASETTIADLHRTWNYGHSFKAAFLSGRYANLVAVACVLTSFAPINGPLLQRASRVVVIEQTTPVTLQTALAASTFVNGTGIFFGRDERVQMFSPEFRNTVLAWNNFRPIPFNGTICKGSCKVPLQGLGLTLDCSSATLPYNLTVVVNRQGAVKSNSVINGTQTFYSDFSWISRPIYGARYPTNFSLNVQYKDQPAVSGDLQIRNCTMYPALVKYPVIINGNASTISLDPSTTIFDDAVQQIYHSAIETSTDGISTYGGINLALSNRYASTANIRYTEASGYVTNMTGSLASQYIEVSLRGSAYGTTYENVWGDPTIEMLAGARDLMFRMSVQAVNASTPMQTVTGEQTQILAVYQSNYAYFVGALVLTAAAIIAVTIILNGFWIMGRDTSLSPIETAKAFGAPMMAGVDGNAKASDIIAAMGTKRVRYGALRDRNEVGKYGERISVAGIDVTKDMKLVVTDDESVIKPRKGWIFAG